MHATSKMLVALIALVVALGAVVSHPPVAPAQQADVAPAQQVDASEVSGDSTLSDDASSHDTAPAPDSTPPAPGSTDPEPTSDP